LISISTMKRILVVDDEPDLLDVIGDHLGDRYEVTTTTSAAAAVEAFRCRRPDVVFCAVDLSGATGIETLQAMRTLDPRVPVVMVAVNMDVGVAESCLELGAFAYVCRPFDLDDMEHMAAIAAGTGGGRRELTASS
jgi:DNA-binding NtrC family response regulator